jgi:peptidoglycan/xylan/chitin deacetylase (PgdA/CDA1 family)
MMRQTTSRRRFVVSVDDPGGLIQDLTLFDRARRFFDSEGLPASFMVVPRGEGDWQLDRQTDWLEALHAAEGDGHDCQLHGLDHKDCEFGPYPAMIRKMHESRDAEDVLKSDTAAYGHNWREDLFRDRLATAISIYESAFSRQPLVFRTGALSQTPQLYDYVADAGMRYVSNSVTDPRGWEYIIENYDSPGDWDPNVPGGPYQLTDRIIDLPIMSEYAWYLTEEKIAPHLALAVDDMHRVLDNGGVFLLVCHVQCVGAADGLSMKLLHQLFDIARDEFQVEFQTIRSLIADIEAGDVPVLAN